MPWQKMPHLNWLLIKNMFVSARQEINAAIQTHQSICLVTIKELCLVLHREFLLIAKK